MSSRRFYRDTMQNPNMVSFTVNVRETDLWVAVDAAHYADELGSLLEDYIWLKRREIEDFIRACPAFKETTRPFMPDGGIEMPDTVMRMIQAGNMANVGPMAAVAGVFSELAGFFLLNRAEEVIIENGGDIFLKTSGPCRVGIYAGNSPLSGRVALEILPEDTPLGVCTSSGTVGHSYSEGRADAAVAVSPSAPLADAAATALGNMVKNRDDLDGAIQAAQSIEGVKGALIICGDKMAAWGQIKLC